MKKLMVSGIGLMLVAFFVMPAAADKGNRQAREGYNTDRPAHSYSHKNNYRRTFKQDFNKERREYQRDMKNNIRAMKRADSPRERERIRRNMRADRHDYKRDVRQLKRDYRYQKHSYRHGRIEKRHKKDLRAYGHSSHYRSPRINHLAFGFWF
ncbi:MAG: hypothetical protein JXK94_14730 [Deltaproteobacteria bacterium]|nr:hypothetical protein [Deltaproteobacteria bacterium]